MPLSAPVWELCFLAPVSGCLLAWHVEKLSCGFQWSVHMFDEGFLFCLVQGRICRKAGKSKKSFSRKEAEATFKSLVKTHEKYGWVTPPVSDGWCYQPALDKNAEQKYCDISSVLYTAHPFLLQLQLHTMNVKETSKLFMNRCVYRGREKTKCCVGLYFKTGEWSSLKSLERMLRLRHLSPYSPHCLQLLSMTAAPNSSTGKSIHYCSVHLNVNETVNI